MISPRRRDRCLAGGLAAALFLAGACHSPVDPESRAGTVDAAPPVADAAPPKHVMSRREMAEEAKRLLRAGDTTGAVTLLSATENLESRDPARAWFAAHYLATAYIAAGDLATASRVLDDALARLPATDTRTRFWVHSARVWVRWGLGDLDGALAAVAAMQDSTTSWPEAERKGGLLHVYWDRAYLHLELEGREKTSAKRRQLHAEAERWRREYEAAAQPAQENAIGRAAIAVHFALAAGDKKAAAAHARVIDEKADAQDQFIAARAALAVGDTERAREMRALIAKEPSVMSALVARELDTMLAAPAVDATDGSHAPSSSDPR